jgi:enamine deaminase RidA (YjgF/YER057c/UK114 family)
MQWQPVPPPSSGVGVVSLPGHYSHWYGITGIATLNESDSPFGARRILTPLDHPDLPSASFYSQAVASGPLVFLAGFIPVKTNEPGKPVVMGYDDVPPEGRFLQRGRSHPDSRDGPIAAQAWYTFDEIRKVLSGVGSSLADIILLTVFLQDVRDFPTFHRVYRHFFPDRGPALSVMNYSEVGHRGTLIEIESTALLADGAISRRDIEWPGAAPFAAPAAVAAGPIVFYSGVLGYAEDGTFPVSGRELAGEQREIALLAEPFEHARGTAAQAVLAIDRLRRLSHEAGGGGLEGIAKMCVYLRSREDFNLFETVRRLMGWSDLPASDFVVIPGPGPVREANIQIEAIGFSGQ